jgi:bifunctional non-homologous end joining protein LigD
MSKRPLDTYAAKRKFNRTPEPAPKPVTGRQGPLLFVVQKHSAQRLHYDFRLELDGVLKSWAVPKGPSTDPADKRLAVETEDHPFDYASFEGVIPAKEYGAGNVIVWDCGVYSPDENRQYSFDNRDEAEARVREELAAGKLSFTLRGEKLKGSYALVRTSTPKQWLLLKHKDRYAGPNALLASAGSVLTGRAVEDVANDEASRLDAAALALRGASESLPDSLAPMLAEIGSDLKSDRRYAYEPKVDGYRALAFIDKGAVRLQSRRGQDLTPAFPELVADLAAQAVDAMVLDGEIVALDADGRPSFNALQNRAKLSTPHEIAQAQRTTSVVYLCFDLLHFAGLNLRSEKYSDRRRYLAQCLLPTPHVQLVHTSDDAAALFAAALDAGFEGVVAKKKDSPYQPGRRSSAWLKFKAVETAEFVIGGYTQGKGAREELGSLLLGYWQDDELHYVGHAGSGLGGKEFEDLSKRLAKLVTKRCPFVKKPPLHRPTTWVEPELVAEVEFAGWTPDRYLRAPVFLRLRDDLEAHSIQLGSHGGAASATQVIDPTPAADDTAATIQRVLEQLDNKSERVDLDVGGARIRLTNLGREYWPGETRPRRAPITKRDLLRYLARVSPLILPHLVDRPLTMIRMPEGIHGERFFQKHWTQEKPEFVETVNVWSGSKSERQEYLLADNLPTLLWLGQVGTLEFHVWHSRAAVGPDAATDATDYSSSEEALERSILNYPDFLVFDIDPYIYSGKEPKGAEPELNKRGFAGGRRVAFWLRELLAEMSLEAVVKTSGKTGLHVFVPIERTVTFDEARTICELVGRHLLRAHPKEITMEWATVKRTGKIFIDYNMNVRGKTLNVAYSPRGVPNGSVSMPLSWDELEAAEPGDFTLWNVMDRLDSTGDRWHDVVAKKQSLTKAFGSVGLEKSAKVKRGR